MEFSTRMEDDLKCPACRRFFTNPVTLPSCRHSMCLNCALRLQTSAAAAAAAPPPPGSNPARIAAPSEDCYPDSDEMSMVSETDSGVVCGGGGGSVGAQSVVNLYVQGGHSIITCPVCARQVSVDERGAAATLPRAPALESIVDRYREARDIPVECQLCPAAVDEEDKTTPPPPRPAVQTCEQCELFYCESCLEAYHPARGALAGHRLVGVVEGRTHLQAKRRIAESKCAEHPDESLSLYCVPCKETICCVCLQDGRHRRHPVQPMGSMCKVQKVSRQARRFEL